jgi:hypothetical protein
MGARLPPGPIRWFPGAHVKENEAEKRNDLGAMAQKSFGHAFIEVTNMGALLGSSSLKLPPLGSLFA